MAFLKRILDAFKSSDAATSQLPPGSDKTRRYLSVDIDQAARESQLLISYVSAEAGIEVDQTVVQKIVNAKYRSQRGDWDAQSEVEFWVALDTMTRAIHPVTMESLIATKPLVRKGRQRASPAQRAVSRYRVLAVLSLLVLLTLQIYWLVGAHANLELNQRTQEIAVADEEIQYIEQAHGDTAGTYDDANLDSLSEKRRAMIRDQEAHFQLLRSWNKKMWLFPTGQTLAGGVTEYRSRQHASELGQVEARIETLTAGLDSGGYAQGIDEPGQQAITRQRIEGELAGLRRAQATLALQPVAEKESNELAAQQLAAHLVVTSLDNTFCRWCTASSARPCSCSAGCRKRSGI